MTGTTEGKRGVGEVLVAGVVGKWGTGLGGGKSEKRRCKKGNEWVAQKNEDVAKGVRVEQPGIKHKRFCRPQTCWL